MSANICDITIDVKDAHDQKLLEVVMIHPKVCDLFNNLLNLLIEIIYNPCITVCYLWRKNSVRNNNFTVVVSEYS